MSRASFLRTLRSGLRGLTGSEVDAIIAEYVAHFEQENITGRGDQDIIASLGDPVRLSRELMTETGLRRWESNPNIRNCGRAIFIAISFIKDYCVIDILVCGIIFLSIMVIIYILFLIAIAVGILLFGIEPLWHLLVDTTSVGTGLIASGMAVAIIVPLILSRGLVVFATYVRNRYIILRYIRIK